MTTPVFQCPHCLTEKVAFTIVAQTSAVLMPGAFRNFLHVQCRACSMPVVAEIETPGNFNLVGDLIGLPGTIEHWGHRIARTWPPIPEPSAPDGLPAQVIRAYLAAETNFPRHGMEEAAAGSYGRALELGTKLYAPDLADKTLYQRITTLAETHRITSELGAWAHEIRSIRNDALHDLEEISRDELTAIRGFTEMLLTYLFTLPGMLAARRESAEPLGNGPM